MRRMGMTRIGEAQLNDLLLNDYSEATPRNTIDGNILRTRRRT